MAPEPPHTNTSSRKKRVMVELRFDAMVEEYSCKRKNHHSRWMDLSHWSYVEKKKGWDSFRGARIHSSLVRKIRC